MCDCVCMQAEDLGEPVCDCVCMQAQDRAYRLGQVRDVSVFRLLAAGTLEEMVYSRQIYKQQQSNLATMGIKERRWVCA